MASGTVTAHIPNVWAIRGFSQSGTATVAIGIDTADLSDGTYDLTMSNPKVDDNDGNVGTPITTSLNGIWKNQATIGDVELDFNFDVDLASGTYTGGQYTITATTI
ncbi:MAG: hypothetical protein ISR54_05790 [Chlorobium phaeobacteroides]|uniref:Uncharacterized protein n=1 Tax=Chlorobium phaeobacteroides (strain BS1) TaxID=331678 RepID=B3EJQ2_CHLPB|nr:hypothetical protein [Chlorobium phaeobacteroides]MBL6956315.1 hypothetical protein [Chlorobium phaeobacteroides]